MWLALIRRFWPLAVVILLIGAGLYYGHTRYESGYAASEAIRLAEHLAAERALAAANEKARRTEADSKALSDQSERQHAETIASLNLRAADAERRYASILREHPANSGSCAVPKDGGAASDPDATRASSELIDRTSRDFAALARRCEADAAALSQLQEWIRDQQALLK